MKFGKNIIDTKNKKYILIGIIFTILLFSIVAFFVFSNILNKDSYAYSDNVEYGNYSTENIENTNIQSIIDNNTKQKKREEISSEEIDLEYITIYQNNANLAKGKLQVLQEGMNGKQRVVTKKIYEGNALIKEEHSGNVIIKASINKIVEVGTGNYKNNYKPKKGDNLYITSYTLDLMEQNNKGSEKITTLMQNTEVKLLEINNKWYKIKTENYTGWVDGECLSNINNNEQQNESSSSGENTNASKAELIAKLNKNMNLNKPSGLSLEQFKKVLSGNKEDINKVFEQNAEYFYYIEKQYNVNGIFVASVGIHESNWGKSKISTDKKNLFGYGASDSNPYNNAYSFKTYSESIDLIARVFAKYYLNPPGTPIYNKEIASGKYCSGNTIEAVNKKYATDKNWNDGVYKWMSTLYNRL